MRYCSRLYLYQMHVSKLCMRVTGVRDVTDPGVFNQFFIVLRGTPIGFLISLIRAKTTRLNR